MNDAQRERARTYRATAKQKARDAGLCTVCSVNDVRTGEPRKQKTKRAILRAIDLAKATGRSTCAPCGVASNRRRDGTRGKGQGRPAIPADTQATPGTENALEGLESRWPVPDLERIAVEDPARAFLMRYRGGAPFSISARSLADVLRVHPEAAGQYELAE